MRFLSVLSLFSLLSLPLFTTTLSFLPSRRTSIATPSLFSLRGGYTNNEQSQFSNDNGNNKDFDQYDDQYADPYEDSPVGRNGKSSFSGQASRTFSGTRDRLTSLGTQHRQLGFALCGGGTLLTVLGVVLFMHKTLLRLGNLMFIAGFPLIIGPGRTVGYFLQPAKARATSCLFVGVLLVFWGRPVLGILLEVFGLLNLFGNLFPLVFAVAKRMPFVGELFSSNGKQNSYSGGNGGGRRDYGSDDYAGGRDDYAGRVVEEWGDYGGEQWNK